MKPLIFALLFSFPALSIAQNCEFDEDQVVEHKLGKSVIKWTTATSGVSIARYESFEDSITDGKQYKYWLSVRGDLTGIRGGFECQIDSAELKLIDTTGVIIIMNYDKTILKNYTGSRMVSYRYSQLFDITEEQLNMLKQKHKCSYSIRVFTSKKGKFSGIGYCNNVMTKKSFQQFIKNIDCILQLP